MTSIYYKDKKSLISSLKDREYGKKKLISEKEFSKPLSTRINESFNKIYDITMALEMAVESRQWNEIERVLGTLITKILDNPNPEHVFQVTPTKKQEREIFVTLGGMHSLLKLLGPPFNESDARLISPNIIHQRGELWNEILVVLREVCFAIPPLADNIFSKQHIVFLFTLLHHQTVFENTMNLLEEVLAVRIDTFSLSSVPDFYGLVERFTTRQLAHFCRVLALVLFEPEDRQIMECSQILKSFELLQLRRDRVAKLSNTVERNQSLIIAMPQLLYRLISLLRIINYGPSLSDLIRYNIVSQTPITSDILYFLSNNHDISEWQHFSDLDEIVLQSLQNNNNNTNISNNSNPLNRANSSVAQASPPPTSDVPSRSSGLIWRASSSDSLEVDPSSRRPSNPLPRDPHSSVDTSLSPTVSTSSLTPLATPPRSYTPPDQTTDEVMDQLLRAFSPYPASDDQHGAMYNIVNVMQVAQTLGIASLTSQGDAIVVSALGSNNNMTNNSRNRNNNGGNGRNLRNSSNAGANLSSTSSSSLPSPQEAKKELQFHAMILAPHQVELLFVLCTLLSGRRKLDVQQKFASLGLADVLLKMFDRLSWEEPPYSGPNPLEHIHGPGCECNPESALRVQYLRLVHNFYDRDFHNNYIKRCLLSPKELSIIENNEELLTRGLSIPSEQKGLLTRIIHILLHEPLDSIYRFWLSSCIEAYLRGSGSNEQIFIVRSGVLSHLIQYILSYGCNISNNLQTAFDLLGELIKYNLRTIELFEESLIGDQFQIFMDIALSNLVDSNVFLRSLYLSMDSFSQNMSGGGSSISIRDQYARSSHMQLTTSGTTATSTTSSKGTSPQKPSSSFTPSFPSKRSNLRSPEKSNPVADQDTYGLRFGYLTHSWVQPVPYTLSRRAVENLSNESSYKRSSSRRSTRNSNRTSTSFMLGASALSSFSDGVRDAFRGLRDAASQLLTGNAPSNHLTSVQTVNGGAGSGGSGDDSSRRSSMSPGEFNELERMTSGRVHVHESSMNGLGPEGNVGVGEEDWGFCTPPESPDFYSRNSVLSSFQQNNYFSQMPSTSSTSSSHPEIETLDKNSSKVVANLHHPNSNDDSSQLSDFAVGVQRVESKYDSIAEVIEEKVEVEVEVETSAWEEVLSAQPSFESEGVKDASFTSFNSPKTSKNTWKIPDSIFRLSLFLVQERDRIVCRLMNTVTIQTVNHENICCVNTALLILILAQKRNQLASLLSRVRNLAKQEEESKGSGLKRSWRERGYDQDITARTSLRSATKSKDNGRMSSPSRPRDTRSGEKIQLSSSNFSGKQVNREEEAADQESKKEADSVHDTCMFRNFRELLWYWSEYYMRRGRDRLSLEFSSQVSFHNWNHIVGLLCSDNGSSTALLSQPISLPQSPYSLRPRPSPFYTEFHPEL